MDEPTTGLDPRSKKEVQEMVRLIRSERAVTILLSTHDLQEAEALCDRVVIIDEGRVLADGRPHELVKRYQAHTLEDVFMLLSGKRLEEDAEEEDDE
jgi:ABC-2 type transport system ATP-binding protein